MPIRERIFPLHTPADVDYFLDEHPLAAVFKASTSDKTLEAMAHVQYYLEGRPDVAVGVIRIPDDRPASGRVEERTGVKHQSPQLILLAAGRPLFDLDNWKINPDHLEPLLAQHLPAALGPAVKNPKVVSLGPYADLLDRFLRGEIGEDRFQWAYLDLLKKEAAWRSDQDFSLLNSLFHNPGGRDFKPAALVAAEFQAKLGGQGRPLAERARELRERLEGF